MDDAIRHLVKTIHDSPGRVMLVTAGAGTQALAWLLGVAGASRTLLEARIPYSEAAFNDFLGRPPDQYVAVETAGLLAGRAIQRARCLDPSKERVIGLACTATISTDRPKKGQHRAHIATWTKERIVRHSLVLHKGARGRDGEEDVVSRLILNALAESYNLVSLLHLPLDAKDAYDSEVVDLAVAAGLLNQGAIDLFTVQPDGTLAANGSHPPAVLSGAFNPLHHGHRNLAAAASGLLGKPVTFELTAANVAKPALTETEILDRLIQFAGTYPVIVSSAPTFVTKARLMPNTTFVVGIDTAERVLQPVYYGGTWEQLEEALTEIRANGCCFLVAGRADSDGVFRDAGQLAVPEAFRDLFQSIPASIFRLDISSSQLRQHRESQE